MNQGFQQVYCRIGRLLRAAAARILTPGAVVRAILQRERMHPIVRFIHGLGVLVLLPGTVVPQSHARLLRFDAPVRELDTVREVDGPVRLRYAFTNVTDRPVVLLDVHTQCGCLQPTFSREAVAPGGRGVVEAVFDPANRLGDFSFGLTVLSTNGDYKKFNTLIARGYVVNRLPEWEIFHPWVLSPLFRADVEAVGMRRFRAWDCMRDRRREIRLYNTSDRTLRPVYDSGSAYLRMSGPAEIAPHSEAVVVYSLNPRWMEPGPFVIRSAVRVGDAVTVIEVRGLIDTRRTVVPFLPDRQERQPEPALHDGAGNPNNPNHVTL